MTLRVVPISVEEANTFLLHPDRRHRHDGALPGGKFAIGVEAPLRLADGAGAMPVVSGAS